MGHHFQMFSPTHWVMLAIFVAGIAPVVRLGRKDRGDADGALRAGRVYAVVLVAVTLTAELMQFLPGEFDFETELPLNLCDFAWIPAAYALWTQSRTPATVIYLWGLVLSTQALITPALDTGFPYPQFFGFWATHFLIVWSAIYIVWGLGIRPSWRGYRITVGITLVWLVGVFVFNEVVGTNYGYVNHKPSGHSVLDFFGPWPSYVAVEVVLVAAVWALMTWPWARDPEGRVSTRSTAGVR
ncbi:MAG TPA: TIGR02206 family membrane protein [Nocardioidaceae bacterium]